MLELLSYKQSIARIYSTSGSPAGGGFLLDQNRLLTCAHVVQKARGLGDDQRGTIVFGETIVEVDLPFFLAGDHKLKTAVTAINWELDVAVLTFAEPLKTFTPLGLAPTPLAEELRHHRYWAYGFPKDSPAGKSAGGVILDINANGWIQLEKESAKGVIIDHGFSGTPLQDEETGQVIGLVVAKSDHPEEGTGWAICTQKLIEAVGPLPEPTLAVDPAVRALEEFYQERINTLTPKIDGALEENFVKLSLLIPQAESVMGEKYLESKEGFDSFETVVEEHSQHIFVLLGDPGSGKSVLLERHQLQMARAQRVEAEGKVPFFARLNRYRTPKTGTLTPLDWLKREWLAQHGQLAKVAPFETLLEEGRLILLLDGLNEIPHRTPEEYDDRMQDWSDFLAQHLGENRAYFSCRSLNYTEPFSERNGLDVQKIQVKPLTSTQIFAFLKKYTSADIAKKVWDQIEGDDGQIALYGTPFFLKLLIDQVGDDGSVPTGRAALITGYIRQSLYKELVVRKGVRLEISGLLNRSELNQIKQKAWGSSPFALLSNSKLITGLVNLAYDLQGNQGSHKGAVSAPLGEIESLILDRLDGEDASDEVVENLIESGELLNLLTRELGNEGFDIRFAHQLMQEYLAARKFVADPDFAKVEISHPAEQYIEELKKIEGNKKIGELPTTGWEETLVLAAEMHPIPERFLTGLLAVNLALAGRCANLATINGQLEPAFLSELKEALQRRMVDGAFDLRDRLASGLALGGLGDPRLIKHQSQEGATYLLPTFAQVEAKEYWIGDDNGYQHERPRHPVTIEQPFELAKYPVTNAEFKRFIDAGGYNEERYWLTETAKQCRLGIGMDEAEKEGWRQQRKIVQQDHVTAEMILEAFKASPKETQEHYLNLRNWSEAEFEDWLDRYIKAHFDQTNPPPLTEPDFWNDRRFNHPNQPVVGISWYEALAYCAWLSALSGEQFGLPTEAEWEAAARRGRSAKYVYGDDFSPMKGNTVETRIYQTTPAGLFGEGASLEEIFDLSGNVWEWTTTRWGTNNQQPEYRYPYRLDDREDLEAGYTMRRVVRGGAWDLSHNYARSAFRDLSLPSLRFYNLGFRLVRRPHLVT